jgi:hypothetical protein
MVIVMVVMMIRMIRMRMMMMMMMMMMVSRQQIAENRLHVAGSRHETANNRLFWCAPQALDPTDGHIHPEEWYDVSMIQ